MRRISKINSVVVCLFALLAQVALVACGGSGSDSDDPITPQPTPVPTRQTVNVDAAGGQQEVTLNSLNAPISDIDAGGATWLSVRKGTYSSGSPSIVLTITANNTNDTRQTVVTINDTAGAIVLLTVIQPGGGSPYTPKTYYVTATMVSENAEMRVSLTDLSTSIAHISKPSDATWLTVQAVTYSSGAPIIQLNATDNTSTEERSCEVRIEASNGDIVILTVKQSGRAQQDDSGTGMDDRHDEHSDQPAWSRKG